MNLIRNKIVKPAILLPILSLFSPFGMTAQAATPCDIELEASSYVVGQTVRMSVFRLSNTAAETRLYEWKLWLDTPDLDRISLANIGFDGSLALSPGFDVDFASLLGPIELFTPDDAIFRRGGYVIGCRLVHPWTGEEYPDADIIAFDVN